MRESRLLKEVEKFARSEENRLKLFSKIDNGLQSRPPKSFGLKTNV